MAARVQFGAHVSLMYELDIVTGLSQFMCVGSLAGVTYRRYTALASPKKGETAVRCCDPALSVHVMLVVSRNVFHVVSALQFILFLWKKTFWWLLIDLTNLIYIFSSSSRGQIRDKESFVRNSGTCM